jgi:ABC-type long-subunit fatty acid transport system fused permease/ATPase subunit
MREINKPGENMKTLFITAIIALSFSTVASAIEVHGEKCPGLAETNKRVTAQAKKDEVKKTKKKKPAAAKTSDGVNV